MAGAAVAVAISISTRNWPAAIWAGAAIVANIEILFLTRRLKFAGTNRCTQCGRHRIGGGVFVAGVGPICFECEERKFGSDILEDTRDVRG